MQDARITALTCAPLRFILALMGGTILVVDDHHEMRQSLRKLLSPRGYVVRLAHDRVSADYAARKQPVDFAIVDQNLAGVRGDRSGLDVADDLAAVHAAIRIVMLTGFPSSDAAFQAGRRRRVVGYLQKPAPANQLLALLEGRAIESARARASLEQIQREYARRVLAECDGNATRAAEVLRVTPATLRRLLDS